MEQNPPTRIITFHLWEPRNTEVKQTFTHTERPPKACMQINQSINQEYALFIRLSEIIWLVSMILMPQHGSIMSFCVSAKPCYSQDSQELFWHIYSDISTFLCHWQFYSLEIISYVPYSPEGELTGLDYTISQLHLLRNDALFLQPY